MSACLPRRSFRSGFLPTVVLVFVVSRFSVDTSCFCASLLVIVMLPAEMAACATPLWLPLSLCGIIGLTPPVFLPDSWPEVDLLFVPPKVPPMDTPIESALYSEWFLTSLHVNVPVVNWFLSGVAVLAITAPFRSVLPLTLMSKPPSPARMPDCSVTLAYVPSARPRLALKLAEPPPWLMLKPPPMLSCLACVSDVSWRLARFRLPPTSAMTLPPLTTPP